MVQPAARVGQRHHSHMMAGLSPFDSKRSKIQRTSRGGCNARPPLPTSWRGCEVGQGGRAWGWLFTPGCRCCLWFSA